MIGEFDLSWNDAETDLPIDYRQVLVEVKPKRRNSPPRFEVGRYFREQKGVHDGEPGWFDSNGYDLYVVRWRYLDCVTDKR
jgi:hypothetical protein